jgi:hypothetical protein
MDEPASSNRFPPASGVPASGTSGPSESEMLQKLRKFAQENPWATNFLANPGLVAVRPQGHDGAEDTPPAGPIIRDERPVSPPSPAAPVANLELSTPDPTAEYPSPTTQLPPSSTIVASTVPPASVTHTAHTSQTPSSEHAPGNTHSPPKYAVLEDVAQVENNEISKSPLEFFFHFYPQYPNTLLYTRSCFPLGVLYLLFLICS